MGLKLFIIGDAGFERLLKRLVQHQVDRDEILLQQMIRDLLAVGDVDEAVFSCLFGQQIQQRDIYAEQIVERVFVFDLAETTGLHPAEFAGVRGGGVVEFGFEFGEEVTTFLGLDKGIFLGGHFAMAYPVVNHR